VTTAEHHPPVVLVGPALGETRALEAVDEVRHAGAVHL